VAALEAARQVARGRVIVAFQPHRYTRTRDCFEELSRAFHGADVVLVTAIYAAGEPKIAGIDAEALVDSTRASGHRDVRLVREREAIVPQLAEIARSDDLVIFMGAGDIGQLAAAYLEGGAPD